MNSAKINTRSIIELELENALPITFDEQDEDNHPAPCTCGTCEPQDYPKSRNQ